MACTTSGTDMTMRTWRATLALIESYGDEISLGGGEQTLHPRFWQILGESIAASEYVWLATNGSITRTALALAKLAKRGITGVALSMDSYHDPIDPEVVDAFTRDKPSRYSGFDNRTSDCRELRNVDGSEINVGRCDFGKEGCVCPGLIITPTGVIKACGCDDAPAFGTVFKPDIPGDWNTGDCYKDQENE